MARRSVALNGLAGCVEIRRGDVRHPESLCAPTSFDAAVFNPPYRRLRSGRMNPDPEKAVARHEIAGTAGDFLAAAVLALKPGGRVYAIYPATRMVELLSRMRAARIEPKRLRIVHSRPGGRGELLLVEGVKGGREELIVLPPLIHLRRRERIYRQRWRLFSGIFPLFPLPAAADLPCHDPFQDLPEFRIPDGREALPHHVPVTSRQRGRTGSAGGGLRTARRGGRELSDGEEKVPDLFLAGEFVDLAEDFLLHELELMQPDRCGDPDEERTPLQCVGVGLSGDLGTDGPPPEVEKMPVRRGMGDVPFLEDLMEDFP